MDVEINVDEASDDAAEAIGRALRLLSAREGGQATYMSEFSTVIRETLGGEFVDPDALERLAYLINAQTMVGWALVAHASSLKPLTEDDELLDEESRAGHAQVIMFAIEEALAKMREHPS